MWCIFSGGTICETMIKPEKSNPKPPKGSCIAIKFTDVISEIV